VSDLPEANPDVVAAATAPGGTTGHDEPVLIFDAATEEEAEVVRATLTAAGIPATLLNSSLNAGAALIGEGVGDTWRNGIFVSPSNVEAARAILNAPSLSDADLIAAEEADPTTLAEAEAEIKYA
jgi:hypothetical protein